MSSRRPAGEHGDVVLGWLTKVVATLAVLGMIGFDAVSLGAGHFRAEDSAQTAARAAAEAFSNTKNLQQAYEAALDEVLDSGATIDPAGFTINPQGEVTLTLRHEAPTLLVAKIPPLRHYAVIDKTGTGRPLG